MDSDLLIELSGSICLLRAETQAGREWLAPRRCSMNWPTAGTVISLDDVRDAKEIAASATADGLSVEWMTD
jgi:hypothetical protein